MSSTLDELYRDIIMDHYRSPRGKRPIEHPDISSEGHNPSCGDDISLEAEVKDGIVREVHVNCHGCAISVASGSMLAEMVKGKTFEEVERIAEIVKKLLKGEIEEIPGDYEDLEALKGVRKFPVRVKCALLAWVTLVEGIRKHGNGDGPNKPIVTTEGE